MIPTPEFDALDQALITLLQEDARLSNREIAERLNSSEPTIRRRVDRLMKLGVLKIVAVASPFALGYRVMAILGLQVERTQHQQVEDTLSTWPEIRFLGVTVGSYDMIMEAWFRDNNALLHFLTQRLGQVPGIQRVESWQVLKLSKYSYDWGKQSPEA
jgi:Lrp/AsnC family transcriptional regulator for asnA, asnC and gidA